MASHGDGFTYWRRLPSRILRRAPREIVSRAYEALSRVVPHDDIRLARDAEDVWNNLNSGRASTREGSHWLGHGSWDEVTWGEYGKMHLAMIEDGRRMSGRPGAVETVVDWGSGGGANASAICPTVRQYFGVDISAINLEECSKQLASQGQSNFIPILIPAAKPEDAIPAIRNTGVTTVDCFFSSAVFQHLPGRGYTRRVTNIAKELLADDGFALINIRYWDLGRQSRILRRSYVDNFRAFNKYTVYEFEVEMSRAGFEVMEIRMQPKTHHAYFFLRKAQTQN